MPYIVEMDFDGQELVNIKEHVYIEKEFKGNDCREVVSTSYVSKMTTY